MSVHIQQTLGPPLDKLKRIRALCNNPHWTMDRRWMIEELARKAERELADAIDKLSEAVSSLVKEQS